MPQAVLRQGVGSQSPVRGERASLVTGPEALVLSVLRDRPAASAAQLEAEGASSSAAKSLERKGMVRGQELDLDGRIERVWTLTEDGAEALGGTAPAAAGKRSGPKLGGLVPWFGAARRAARFFGEATRGCPWVGVPFAGSLAEVPAILAAGAREVVINDLHRGLINLARVAADAREGPRLYRRLRRQAFSPVTLREAQAFCQRQDPRWDGAEFGLDPEHACRYFVCAWAGRSANAGTAGELRGQLATRWDGGGGGSALRFSGAAWSIREWRKVLARCAILCMDGFEFLEAKVKDHPGCCAYVDPPWPGPGQGYLHSFGKGAEEDRAHRRLAAALARFSRTRVVLRTGGDPLTRSLYRPEDGWKWLVVDGRDQTNAAKAEWVVRRN